METEQTFGQQNNKKENEMNDEKERERKRKRRRNLTIGAAVAGIAIVLIVGGLLLRPLVGGGAQAKTYTIGIISYVDVLRAVRQEL